MVDQPQVPNTKGQRILRGTNFAIYTVIAVAIIVLVNWFASQHVRRWDLTKNHRYSLSEQSRKLVKGLKEDVTIYVFDRDQSFRTEGDLLNLYPAASHHVAVRYIDPNRDPALAKEFGVRSYGTVVVAAGNRHFDAQSTDEQGVTNALIRVLKAQSTVYFIQGHGERNPDSVENDGLSEFSKALGNENDTVKSLALMEQKFAIPSDATLVVIAGPQHDYLTQEVDALQKYLTGGGRLLLMLDPGVDLPNLSKLASDYNFTPSNDLVIDQNPIAQVFGARPEMPLILKYGASPITQPLERTATLFPLTRSFDVNKTYKSGLTVDSLCDTTAESYGVPNWTPEMREIRLQPKTDLKGPLTVALAADMTSGEGKPNARLVAMGTSRIATNSFINFQGNRDLIMNTVDWLTANESMISVRAKAPDAQHLNLTAEQMSTILYRLIAVPLVIIAAGIIVWWGRR